MTICATNETRQSVIAERVEIASTFGARFRGLMGRDSLPEGAALLIVPCDSIHMFFMRFAIDAIYLDRSGCVIALDRGLRPWRIGSLHRHVYAVLEAAPGSIDRSGTEVGDCVSFGDLFS